MNIIIKQIEMIERIDRLIRLQATGTPVELASRLGMSRAQTYRIIDIMKELNAPITYDFTIQSFVYEESVGFKFGFYTKELDATEIRSVSGGNSFERLQYLAAII
ncbi:hypothetical protein ATO12_09150 [Aquimarina atlantica]|uniref:DNA-binding protein n=1 Tax=Aquimarina atlantica TaxID=1317122 RepID=A0A023BXX0_9FLAO|nr:hypothetical protein [Aquimarina atlantica]EZH74896.1 hypothetical protein ATO12_09150 [Aquimarina atlantica]